MDSPDVAHDDRANILIAAVCIVCSVATIAVGLRFYTRSCMLKQLGADDYLVFTAWAFALATGISQCLNTRNGLGKHVWDLGGDLGVDVDLMNYQKGFYVSITLYNTGLMFVKLAFLTQYYRVLSIKKMRTTFIAAMVIIGCWSLSQVIIGIFICDPVSGFWEQSTESKCIPNLTQWYINAAGNIATDIAIFVLPLPVLVHLHLPRAQRLVLIGIFSLGFFTCAISVVRVKFLKQGGDFSYENVEGSSWSITELCSGVTCACLPTLRPLVSKWVPSLSNRLHMPGRGYKRQSAFGGAAAQGGSRHLRGDSDGSNMLDIRNKDEFFYCVGIEERSSGSADGSDEVSELRRSSPTRPACAHIAVHGPNRPTAYYNWMKSSVTTKIGTGTNSERSDSNTGLSTTAIQVQREVVMHKV
nr:C066A protein [Hypoxylon sp. CO27-5]